MAHMATTHRLNLSVTASRKAQSKPFVGLKNTTTKQQRLAPVAVSPVDLIHFAALDIDWSDPDVQLGAFGGFLGIALGIGAPIFYTYRDRVDEERLEELRALNRAAKEETGEYLSPEEIAAIRTPRWTDRREYVDDD